MAQLWDVDERQCYCAGLVAQIACIRGERQPVRSAGDWPPICKHRQPAAVVLRYGPDAPEAHARLAELNVELSDVRYGPGWRERFRAEMQSSTPGSRSCLKCTNPAPRAGGFLAVSSAHPFPGGSQDHECQSTRRPSPREPTV